MSARLVVVGGGFAGLAAATYAAERGAEVTLIERGGGASRLFAGAIDQEPWDRLTRAIRLTGSEPTLNLDPEVLPHVQAWGGFRWAEPGRPMPLLATTVGVVRRAVAHDEAMLDLSGLGGRTVLIAETGRAAWDEGPLARGLAESLTRSNHPTQDIAFEPVAANLLRFEDEARMPDADLAARHDDPARLAWLADRLRPLVSRRGADRVAVLVGPWLGIEPGRRAWLEEALGCPVGEALSAHALTAGLRFERRQRALLLARKVTQIEGTAVRLVGEASGGFTLELGDRKVPASAVVLALGGLISGAITYRSPEFGAGPEGPTRANAPFELGIVADGLTAVRMGHGGFVSAQPDQSGAVSSAFGPSLDEFAWPGAQGSGVLERVGARSTTPGVELAGDFAEGAPRTVWHALVTGVRAAQRALEHAKH